MWISGSIISWTVEAFNATHGWLWGIIGLCVSAGLNFLSWVVSPETDLWVKVVVVALYVIAGLWIRVHMPQPPRNSRLDRVVNLVGYATLWLPFVFLIVVATTVMMFYMLWLCVWAMVLMFAFMIVIFEAPVRWIFGI